MAPRAQEAPRHSGWQGPLAQMRPGEIEGQNQIYTVIDKEKASRSRSDLADPLSQIEEETSGCPGSPEVKGHRMAPRFENSSGHGNKIPPTEDFVIGDDVEDRDHSKRIPSLREWPWSQGPTGILFPPGT